MAKKYIDIPTLKFQLYNVHDLQSILSSDYFGEHDEETINLFLESIKDFSDQELYPVFTEMDTQPAYFKDGQIMVHPVVGTVMKKGGEMGIIASPVAMEHGGLQLPLAVHTTAYAIMEAANNHLLGYPGLTLGSAELILSFGSDELKETYCPRMLSGEWAGTMCLTEPQAGSSLSDVATTASPQADGSYKIKGQKIFISGGDHQFSDNFVHLVLARIDGAPAGTKGISLFVVPKNRIKDDGSLEFNDVITAGDFQKMGQRGYCTAHLIFGESDDCRGWLVGEPHRGLKYMFQMMNGARIAVGRGAAAIAMAAYHASLEYANERPQGRKIGGSGKKDATSEQTLIVNHPDVRRMLLLQKALSEGGMSIVMQGAHYHDKMASATDPKEKEKYHLLLEMMTPIVKTFPSEKGITSTNNGVQVLGGYGFCSEYILQQYLRDMRIFAIYEGTTGIQSLDLLGRKMMMQGGKGAHLLAQEINATIMAATAYDELKPYAKELGVNLKRIAEVMEYLGAFAQKGDFERFLSDATVFMDFMGTIVGGWQWLKMATAAKEALVMGNTTYDAVFYESKIHTMKFYFKYEMQKTPGMAEILTDDEVLTVAKGEEVIV
ncbi:MAG TPA: acyl-CoA dehydrogenase [Bacteroidetes bacterium]|nr:acyl-CoA dehydrogenase [Bacteroidota bacterium]